MLRKSLFFLPVVAAIVFAMIVVLSSGRTPGSPAITVPAQAATAPALSYFLRDADLSTGELALVLHRAGPEGTPLVVRDRAAIVAARNSATAALRNSEETGALATLYRDDMPVMTWPCAALSCDDADLSGLTQTAVTAVPQTVRFADYDTYLAQIAAITADPNFGFLDLRPQDGLPAARVLPRMTLALPSVIIHTGLIDEDVHIAMVTQALQDTLPPGARIDGITISALGPALIGDSDNSMPVLRNGTPIVFDMLQYYAVTVQLSGVATLDADTLEQLGMLTRVQQDAATEFAAFAAAQLGNDCADCYQIVVEGEMTDKAVVTNLTPEVYTLTYYDLREAP